MSVYCHLFLLFIITRNQCTKSNIQTSVGFNKCELRPQRRKNPRNSKMSGILWVAKDNCPTMQRRIFSDEPQSIGSSGYSVHERPLPHHTWGTELSRWTESCQPVVLVGWLQSISHEGRPCWWLPTEICCLRNIESLGERGERTAERDQSQQQGRRWKYWRAVIRWVLELMLNVYYLHLSVLTLKFDIKHVDKHQISTVKR